MRIALTAAIITLAAGLASCGGGEPPKPVATNPPVKTPEPPKGPPSDPSGKYQCLKCSTSKEPYKTSALTCPRCGETLASAETPKHTPTNGDKPGKSAMAPGLACPQEGCTYTSARTGDTCLKHPETVVKEVWYVCAACSEQAVAPGKCGKCQKDLTRTMK